MNNKEIKQVISAEKPKEMHRYTLSLPESLWRDLEKVANRHGEPILQTIRKSIRLRLRLEEMAEEVPGVPGAKQLDFEFKGKDHRILFL